LFLLFLRRGFLADSGVAFDREIGRIEDVGERGARVSLERSGRRTDYFDGIPTSRQVRIL
jgi:hypothetical protein